MQFFPDNLSYNFLGYRVAVGGNLLERFIYQGLIAFSFGLSTQAKCFKNVVVQIDRDSCLTLRCSGLKFYQMGHIFMSVWLLRNRIQFSYCLCSFLLASRAEISRIVLNTTDLPVFARYAKCRARKVGLRSAFRSD